MITYWPCQQGTQLNRQVSILFKKIYIKLNYNLYNKTSQILSIDIVNSYVKQELFKIILLELEILILDIIELDVTVSDLELLNKRVLVDLIKKSLINFQHILKIDVSNEYLSRLYGSMLYRRIILEHQLLLQNLLIYLIFGTSSDTTKTYLFPNNRIPVQHVEILLDNLVIQVADLIFYVLINADRPIMDLFYFLKVNRICRNTYVSARSIATFKNNLVWNNYICYYFYQPRIIYNNRYQVWIFSTKGLHCQYIYAYRENELALLSSLQVLVIILLELQDFILPKIQTIFLLIGRVWIYLVRYAITNSFKVILKSIAVVMRTK
uniref:Ycf55 n=1 Tax=Helminthora furcellata TaxID=1884666 RepID=A0A1G4NR92_9FLOR|nr:Hypothetical protein ycf55 [Helminthora furcellata]SCW21059.1 Hypothetical protein ycf55 [Helminthora furcellata]SCW23919.1 Hypothetical protein ycf55 [Helminthora furcellata]